jgi:hypothetical protein
MRVITYTITAYPSANILSSHLHRFPLHPHLPVETLERDTRHKPRDAHLLLHPILHEIRYLLRSTPTLPDELHLRHRRSTIFAWLRGFENEGTFQVVLARYAHLAVIVESEFETDDFLNRFAEFFGFH